MPQAQTREPEQLSLFAHNGTTSPEQARVQTVIIPVAAAPAVASTCFLKSNVRNVRNSLGRNFLKNNNQH